MNVDSPIVHTNVYHWFSQLNRSLHYWGAIVSVWAVVYQMDDTVWNESVLTWSSVQLQTRLKKNTMNNDNIPTKVAGEQTSVDPLHGVRSLITREKIRTLTTATGNLLPDLALAGLHTLIVKP